MFDIHGCVSNVAGDVSTFPIRKFLLSATLLALTMFFDVSINHSEASKLKVSKS